MGARLLLLLLLATPVTANDTVRAVPCADGATLKALRLQADGPPILLCHGYGSNANQFLLPERNFARFLQRRGFDVWCLNFRGIGRGVLRSGGSVDHSFDDLVALDLPAAVRAVRAETGRRPFLMGHSMGGMLSLAWAQGAVRVGRRMGGSPSLAAHRATQIRGVVAIGSPSRFTWPKGEGASRWDHNRELAFLSRDPARSLAERLIADVPHQRASVTLGRLLDSPLARPLRRRLWRARSPVLEQVMAPESIRESVLTQALRRAVGPAPLRVRRQFLDGIRTGDMRELTTRGPVYSYADGHAQIVAPVLWIAGRRDKLANDEAIVATVRTLRSDDATCLRTHHGHVDLVLGDDARERVWEPIAAWLERR